MDKAFSKKKKSLLSSPAAAITEVPEELLSVGSQDLGQAV